MRIFVHYFQTQTLSRTLICSVRSSPKQMRTEKPENFLFTKQEKKEKEELFWEIRASFHPPPNVYCRKGRREGGGGGTWFVKSTHLPPFPNYRLERRKLDLILLLIDRPIYFREKQYLLLLQYLPNGSCQVSTKMYFLGSCFAGSAGFNPVTIKLRWERAVFFDDILSVGTYLS